jgi:hypothetical protein
MPRSLIYDAVTLLNFAVIRRLDILEERHSYRPEPRWTEAVKGEIEQGALMGLPECHLILDASWLGKPVEPNHDDLGRILPIWIGLNDGKSPPIDHAGEAESIYFAERLEAAFATDDNEAHLFASRRPMVRHVIDTVDILRDSVAAHELPEVEASSVVASMRAAGRSLRRTHPPTIDGTYFR